MARRYYDTRKRIYELFTTHPVMSVMLNEWDIELDRVKDVADFLLRNHTYFSDVDISQYYVDDLSAEFDQPFPGPPDYIRVEEYSELPTKDVTDPSYLPYGPGLSDGDYIFVRYPSPTFFKWEEDITIDPEKGRWIEDYSYYEAYMDETGHMLLDMIQGYYKSISGEWVLTTDETDISNSLGEVLTYRSLPDSPTENDVWYVKAEDPLDIIFELYGLLDAHPGWTPPYNNSQYVGSGGTILTTLLYFTIYLYKFGVSDNFYESHILDFFPEYDREQIQENPKLKLSVESLGRKLDDLENKISRIPDLYDIDECPDELLDYLGQIIGYEKEDYTLDSVSFRELLKNIIEVYKIKGTGYSFEFFFKFLGFDVEVIEFYFNRDVENPRGFPAINDKKSAFYLTTTNPLFETSTTISTIKLKPITHLEATRDLNDWRPELDELEAAGCTNASAYMRGLEIYNGTGDWHSNPWTYFKTNLIEYQLTPYDENLRLSARDNNTIKKYIRFLSPTYLFTWVNINLRPWMEPEDPNVTLLPDPELNTFINKTLGDPRPTPENWPQFQPGGTPDGEGGWLLQGAPDHPHPHPHLPGEEVYDPFTKKTAILNDEFDEPYKDYEDMETGIPKFGAGYEGLSIYQTDGDQLLFTINNQMFLPGEDHFETVGFNLRHDGTHIRQIGHPKFVTDATHGPLKRLSFDQAGGWVHQNAEFAILATSLDGADWTGRTSSFTGYINKVAYNGSDLWVAVGYGGQLATSLDRVIWAQQTSSFDLTNILNIAHDQSGLWVAVGSDGKLATATDPTGAWTQQANPFTADIWAIAHDGSGLWVAGGSGGEIATSLDGETWSALKDNPFQVGFAPNDIRLLPSTIYDIAHGDGLWMAVGEDGKIITSIDGDTWEEVEFDNSASPPPGDAYFNPFERKNIYSAAHNQKSSPNGKWILAGEAGILAASYDPTEKITWVLGASGTTEDINDIAHDGADSWIIVSRGGDIASSFGGESWTQEISPFDDSEIHGVGYGGGSWVTAGHELFNDHSFRSYPAVPIDVRPFANSIYTDSNDVLFRWLDEIKGHTKYWIQIASVINFSTISMIVTDDTLLSTDDEYTYILPLHNNRYYWRLRVRNSLTSLDWGPWSSIWSFNLRARPFPFDGEVITEETLYIDHYKDNENEEVNDFTMLWSSVPGAEEYRVRIYGVGEYTTTLSQLPIESLPNGSYQWAYKTKLDGEWGEYPEPEPAAWMSFTINIVL